jgi:integrase
MKTHRGITTVSDKTENRLRERQIVFFEDEQKELVDWLLDSGKDPENDIGYSKATVKTALYRIDKFHRYAWDEYVDGFTTVIDQSYAEQYLRDLARQDYENSYKKSFEKALKLFYKWRHHERGADEWELDWGFETQNTNTKDDELNRAEISALRGAAVEYDSLPTYSNVSPSERDRWKEYISDQLGKKKSEVTKRDWEQADSWKVPSLVWTALDAGLRPDEIERATVSWVNLDEGIIQIPKDDDPGDSWIVALRGQTVRALESWLEERQCYNLYEDSDKLWLTRQGNPYRSGSLNYLFKQLSEIANIDTSDRRITWTSLRESVASYLADSADAPLVQEQLRYDSERSVERFESSVEKRKSILERMG